jgi:hypothetical protein
VTAKGFFKIQDNGPSKWNKNVHRPNARAITVAISVSTHLGFCWTITFNLHNLCHIVNGQGTIIPAQYGRLLQGFLNYFKFSRATSPIKNCRRFCVILLVLTQLRNRTISLWHRKKCF